MTNEGTPLEPDEIAVSLFYGAMQYCRGHNLDEYHMLDAAEILCQEANEEREAA